MIGIMRLDTSRFLDNATRAGRTNEPVEGAQQELGSERTRDRSLSDFVRRVRQWHQRRNRGAQGPHIKNEGDRLLSEAEGRLSAGTADAAETRQLESLHRGLLDATGTTARSLAQPTEAHATRRDGVAASMMRHQLQGAIDEAPNEVEEPRYSSTATSLLTERLHDGEANCIERAALSARPEADEILFMQDRFNLDGGDDAGHALIRDRATGAVWDPNDGQPPADPAEWKFRTLDDWVQAQGPGPNGEAQFKLDGAVSADTVLDVLNLPPAARADYIQALGNPELSKVAHRMYALPDRPEDPASDATMRILERQSVPIDETVLASPNLRPREVERAADAGRLTQSRGHPGSTFLGALGEAHVIQDIRDRWHMPLVPNVVVSQPATSQLPAEIRTAIGGHLPDILAVEVGGSIPVPRLRGVKVPVSVTMRNTIGPNTGGRARTVNFGPTVLTSLREVTTSGNWDYLEDRATKVATWARGMPRPRRNAKAKFIAVLDIDRATYFRLQRENPARMRRLVQRVTQAGGYIQLHRDMTADSIQRAQSISTAIRNR